MKNIKLFVGIIIGLIVSGIAVYASGLASSNISYTNDKTVADALDELYSAPTVNKYCEYKNSTYGDSSNHYSIGTMYECTVGYNNTPIKYKFFILSINNDNTVDLIMDRNITQETFTTTMTWNNAMKYIDNNSLKTTWSNVLYIDLPKAQAIANAVGRSSWIAADSGATWWCLASKTQDSQSAPYCNTEQAQAYNWLYDYTRECNGCTHSLGSTEAYGYWTRDLISNTARAWGVGNNGYLSDLAVSIDTSRGVRPVITVLKSSLYENN